MKQLMPHGSCATDSSLESSKDYGTGFTNHTYLCKSVHREINITA